MISIMNEEKFRLHEKERILLIASNIWYLGEGMLGPLYVIFCERIGGNILEISWAWAIYLITVGILVIFIGNLSDKIGKEKLLLIGYILNTICTFAYLLVSTPIHLFIVQAGLGVSAALTIPTWLSLYAKNDDRKRDGLTWGIVSGFDRIVTGIAIIIGGLIVTYFSFTVLFVTMGIVQIIATLYLINIFKII